jgi:hypothetical protein
MPVFQPSERSIDAFFSYARDDNKVHQGYIQDFWEDLKGQLAARLRQREDELGGHLDCNAEPEFFIDQKGLPLNGDFSEELRAAVEKSMFLFIFIGMRYPQSKWCGEELKWFIKSLDANRVTALKRTFLIVLEGEAERRDWGDFLEKPERPQFVAFYNPQGQPIPRFLEREGQAVFNPRYTNRLNEICTDLIDRALEVCKHERRPSLVVQGRERAPPERPRVTIGLATRDLKSCCQELAEKLEPRHRVEQLAADDFFNAEPETFAAEYLGAQAVFIQPYSRAKVIRMPDRPGGHLYRLKTLINGQGNLLWWRVDDTQTALPAREDDPQHLQFLKDLDAEAFTGSVEELAAHVEERLKPRTLQPILLPPTIYIESSTDDANVTRLLEDKLRDLWRQGPFSQLGELLCIHVPWDQLHAEGAQAIENGHGVIFVFGHKTFHTLTVQIQNFERLAFSRQLGKAVAVAPPHSWRGPVGYPISFYCEPPHTEPGNGGQFILKEEDTAKQLLQHIHQIYRAAMNQTSAA